ncbi:MAG: hypothetical protein J6P44_07480 [Bacteroidales bacterium]|nr:hypothetical protein [Bacteroidales bacterium]
MNIEVYLHGVPSGQKVSDNGKDVRYISGFYNGNVLHADRGLVIEVVGKKIYYTYLKYDLIANDNRQGSYFGLTLMIDANYYENYLHIYSLLEGIYRQKIDGSIIKNNKFIVADFTKQLQEEISKIIEQDIISNHTGKIFPILDGFVKQKGELLRINCGEINDFEITKLLKKNLVIYLSDLYQTNLSKVKDFKQKIENKDNEISSLTSSLQRLENEKSSLKSEIQQMKEQNKKLQDQKSFSENINRIETPIKEIAQYLQKRQTSQGRGKLSGKKILLIIIAVLLAVNVIMFFKFNTTLKEINRNTTLLETIIEDLSDNHSQPKADRDRTAEDTVSHQTGEEHKEKDVKE